jgi:hypothetical protein
MAISLLDQPAQRKESHVDLGNIINDRATAQATYMGDTLDFKYRPGMITPNTYAKLQNDQTVDELAEFFTAAIVTWNLTETDENGDKRTLEVTTEVVRRLPMGLIRSIANAIMSDVPQRDVGNVSSDS